MGLVSLLFAPIMYADGNKNAHLFADANTSKTILVAQLSI